MDKITQAVAVVLAAFKRVYPNIQIERDTAEGWADLLADLPDWAVLKAGRLLLLESKFPTLPSVGDWREAADEIVGGAFMSGYKAFYLARRNLDVNPAGFAQGVKTDRLDEDHKFVICETVNRFGPRRLQENDGTAEHQLFNKIYDQVVKERRRTVALERIGETRRSADVLAPGKREMIGAGIK